MQTPPPARATIEQVFAKLMAQPCLEAGILLPAKLELAQQKTPSADTIRRTWRRAVQRLTAYDRRNDSLLLRGAWRWTDSEALAGLMESRWLEQPVDPRLGKRGLLPDAFDSLVEPAVRGHLGILRSLGYKLVLHDGDDALFRIDRKPPYRIRSQTDIIAIGDDPDYMMWRFCSFALADCRPSSEGGLIAVAELGRPVFSDLGQQIRSMTVAGSDGIPPAFDRQAMRQAVDSMNISPGDMPVILGDAPVELVRLVLDKQPSMVTIGAASSAAKTRIAGRLAGDSRVMLDDQACSVEIAAAAMIDNFKAADDGQKSQFPVLLIGRLGQDEHGARIGFTAMMQQRWNAVLMLHFPKTAAVVAAGDVERLKRTAGSNTSFVESDGGYDIVMGTRPLSARPHSDPDGREEPTAPGM